MAKYEMIKEDFKDGIIVIEHKANGKFKYWFALNEKDFTDLVKAEADLYRIYHDIKSFDDAVEFIKKELQGLHLLRQDEIDGEWCDNNPEIAKLALTYGWAIEADDE